MFEGGAYVRLSAAELADAKESWLAHEVAVASEHFVQTQEGLSSELPPLQVRPQPGRIPDAAHALLQPSHWNARS